MELEPQENNIPSESSSFPGNATRGALALLALVALVLGYFVYQKVTESTTPAPPDIAQETAPQEVVFQPSTPGPFDLPPLSEDEREALDRSATAGTQAVTAAYLAAVEKAAVPSDIVAMGADCTVYPAVVKTQKGANLEFGNLDTIPHTIVFSKTRSYLVPAQGRATVPVDFGEAGKAYSYTCEKDSSVIGILWLAE